LTLYVILPGLCVFLICFYCSRNLRLVPVGLQLFIEGIYLLVYNIIKQQVGNIGLRYMPMFFCLFIYIYSMNVFGLIPYSFTSTSHLICTCTLGFSIVFGILVIGLIGKGLSFFQLFVPQNVPSVILPFIVVIEVMSYLIRPISLSMRLFANIMAGHTLMYILSAFTITLMDLNVFGLVVSLALMLAIMVLEFGIAFLQAYVFVVLTSVYLNDSM
jgi:F-type H+-transporting ATPase subunit a